MCLWLLYSTVLIWLCSMCVFSFTAQTISYYLDGIPVVADSVLAEVTILAHRQLFFIYFQNKPHISSSDGSVGLSTVFQLSVFWPTTWYLTLPSYLARAGSYLHQKNLNTQHTIWSALHNAQAKFVFHGVTWLFEGLNMGVEGLNLAHLSDLVNILIFYGSRKKWLTSSP